MNIITSILQAVGLATTGTTFKLPARLPAAWMGIDRSGMPQTPGSGVPAGHANLTWFGLLMDNSNLRFTGAYLEGVTFPAGATANQFTNSTRDVNRDWVPNVAVLRGEGWGIVFWYVGYSVGGGEPLPSTAALAPADYAARGQLHAQHAKTIVGSISPAMDGAVVYMDNEDGTGTNVAALLPYYNAFFDELQVPGPGTLPALRPGLYAHNPIAAPFVASRPQLFVWEVTYDTSTTTTASAPFDQKANPLVVDATRGLSAFGVPATSPARAHWPIGRQFRSYTGAMPIANSPIASISGFIPYASWDYDSAVVRDPAYPCGDPRFAIGIAPGAAAGTADPIVVEGRFTARGADPPQMLVDMILQAAHLTIPLLPGQPAEPDAPIAIAAFPGAQQSNFATILTSNDVAVADSASRTWANTGSSATIVPRRLRALAYAIFAASDLQILFVGRDLTIWGIRNTGAGWSTPAQIGGTLKLHPSAMLAATSRASASVDVFSFNDAGLLTTTWWSPSAASWPGGNSQVLETAPGSFLPMSAIAAVSAAPNLLHVFAIGTDLHLHFLQFTNTAWGGVQAVGAATDFVFAHSRVAAHAPSATLVQVVVIADNGNARVHTLDGSSGTWTETLPPLAFDPAPPFPDPSYTPPDPSVPVETAYGWRVNPYGDLAIGLVSGDTKIFAAGLYLGATAVLRHSLTAGSEWERYR